MNHGSIKLSLLLMFVEWIILFSFFISEAVLRDRDLICGLVLDVLSIVSSDDN